MHRDPKDLMRAAIDQGFRVEPTAGGHWMFYPPDKTKRPVLVSRNPDALRKAIRDLKKVGFRE